MPQETNYCPLCQHECGSTDQVGTVDTTHSGAFSRSRFDLRHCRDCDVIRLDPLPTEADLRVLYQESDQFSDPLYTDDERIAAALEYYGVCLDQLGLMPASGEYSLEIGAGFSWVSRAIYMRNREVTTIAQDVTDECSDRCPWVSTYIIGSVDDVPDHPGFRLISLTHVIEHLLEPAEMIRKLAGRLRAGGRIFITAPFRPVGWKPGDGIEPWRDYSYLHVPAHISYLSRTWFEQAASGAGLKLVHWDTRADGGQAFEAVLERPVELSRTPIRRFFFRMFSK